MQSKRLLPLLIVLYLSAFVAAFNENIMNVALVAIMGEYGVVASVAQWLVTGYMMVTTLVVVISAYLYLRLGLRRLFFVGVLFLTLGSVSAMYATTFPALLTLRLVQAIGTGIFIPAMMSTILAIAPRKKLGLYLSVGGMMITFGPAFGPVVSGLMVTFFGWRTIFLPTLASIVIIGAIGSFAVRDTAEAAPVRLDIPSVALIAIGVFGLVFGLSEVTMRPGLATGCFLAGMLVLAVFVRRQFHLEDPVLNFVPMTSVYFWPSAVLVVVAMMTTFSLSVLLPLYFQGSLGMSALTAGALLLLPILINAATSVVGGRIMDRRGPWPLLFAGFLTIVVGQTAMFLASSRLSGVGVVVASAVVFGGVGLVLSPSQAAGLATLSDPEHPHGVALLNTFVQIAASIGPALLIGIMTSRSSTAAASGLGAQQSNAEGFAQAILVAGVIAIVGAAFAVSYSRILTKLQLRTKANRVLTIGMLMRTEVFFVSADATIREVLEQFVLKRISGAPVVDADGGVCGYITDGNILRAVSPPSDLVADFAVSLGANFQDPEFRRRADDVLELNVMELAAESVTSVRVESPVEQVSELLGMKHLKKVPVVSDAGKLVGIVTRGDLILSLLGILMQPPTGDSAETAGSGSVAPTTLAR